MILAGGRGTRLGALTKETPKPLLPVGGRPFIDWVVANLERQGVRDVVVTAGYRAEVFDDWLSRRPLDEDHARVRIHVEEEPLDTGGALCLLEEELDDRFFVLNGDTLLDVPLDAVAAGLRVIGDGSPPLMAVALREVPDVGRYGAATLRGGRVVEFTEKESGGRGLINGGVYALRRDAITGRTAPLSIERDLIPELVAAGRVTGIPCDGFFIDIGLPETLAAAEERVPEWWAGRGGEAR